MSLKQWANKLSESVFTEEETVWNAIEKNYGKDDLLDHLLDDWLEAEMQEEAEAEGWL